MILDGPPGSLPVTADAIGVSTFVVVPMRATGLDLLASQECVELCQEAGVPFLSYSTRPRAGTRWLLNAARAPLSESRIPIANTSITQRTAFVTAATTGRTGAEKDAAASEEVDALWREIKAATLKAAKAQQEEGEASMASDEEIEFASLFSPARYAKETKATQRMQAERRAAQTDKQHSRDGRARSVQVNFRSTPAFKALAAGLAKHLDLSVQT